MVGLATSTYAGFNRQHLIEMLAEIHGIVLSRSTVHRILAVARTAVRVRACCSRSTRAATTGWRVVDLT
ncbi:MAG: hypothetical protein ABSE84_05115 [Isosphaeraceae bacterium]